MELLAGRQPPDAGGDTGGQTRERKPLLSCTWGTLALDKLSGWCQSQGTKYMWASWTLVIQAHRGTHRIQLGPWRLLRRGSDQTLGQSPGRQHREVHEDRVWLNCIQVQADLAGRLSGGNLGSGPASCLVTPWWKPGWHRHVHQRTPKSWSRGAAGAPSRPRPSEGQAAGPWGWLLRKPPRACCSPVTVTAATDTASSSPGCAAENPSSLRTGPRPDSGSAGGVSPEAQGRAHL